MFCTWTMLWVGSLAELQWLDGELTHDLKKDILEVGDGQQGEVLEQGVAPEKGASSLRSIGRCEDDHEYLVRAHHLRRFRTLP